jgi:hypothetical protein
MAGVAALGAVEPGDDKASVILDPSEGNLIERASFSSPRGVAPLGPLLHRLWSSAGVASEGEPLSPGGNETCVTRGLEVSSFESSGRGRSDAWFDDGVDAFEVDCGGRGEAAAAFDSPVVWPAPSFASLRGDALLLLSLSRGTGRFSTAGASDASDLLMASRDSGGRDGMLMSLSVRPLRRARISYMQFEQQTRQQTRSEMAQMGVNQSPGRTVVCHSLAGIAFRRAWARARRVF